MFRLLRLVVVLAILGGLGYGANRLAVDAAQHKIAKVVQADAHLAHPPTVRVRGFAFLWQALRGRYDRIDVASSDVFDRLAGQGGSVVTLRFEGVHIPASEALHGQVHRIPVDRVSGSVEVTFADLEAAAAVPGLTIAAVAGHQDQVSLGETVDVAGARLAVHVIATVSAAHDAVALAAGAVTVAGRTLPASVAALVRSKAGFSVRIPGVPAGVSLAGVTVDGDGLAVGVSAGRLVLTR
jgi:LmeA-like phospholipid-binding